MNALAPDDIAWARMAARDGRPVEYIASVLGVKAGKVDRIVNAPAPREVTGRYAWRAEQADTRAARAKAEALFAHEVEKPAEPQIAKPVRLPDARDDAAHLRRRRFLLTVRYAKHWDLLWFLAGQGMSNRTLVRHFGRDCVRWARGYLFWEEI